MVGAIKSAFETSRWRLWFVAVDGFIYFIVLGLRDRFWIEIETIFRDRDLEFCC